MLIQLHKNEIVRTRKKVNPLSLEYLNSFYCRNLQTVKILTDKFVFKHGLRKFIFQDLLIEPRD